MDKKLSFDEKLEKNNFNFTKKSLLYFILPVVLIIVGVVLFSTINFNLGIDFVGGSSLTIYTNTEKSATFSEQGYDLNNNKEYKTAKNLIKSTLKKHGVSVNSCQKVGVTIEDYAIIPANGEVNSIIVKYKNKSDDVATENSEIRTAILEAFGYGAEYNDVFVVSGTENATVTSELLMKISIGVIVCIVLIFAYTWIRFNFTGALAVLLASMLDVLMTIAALAITRIPLTTAFIPVLFGVLIFSVINSFVIIGKMRENLKVAISNDDVDNVEIANKSISTNLTRNIFIACLFVLATGVVMAFAGLEIAFVLIPVALGVMFTIYTSMFITPSLWAISYKISKRQIARLQEKQQKKNNKEDYQV